MAMAKQIRQLSAQQTRIEAKLDKVLELLAASRHDELSLVEPIDYMSAEHMESITAGPVTKPKPAAQKKPVIFSSPAKTTKPKGN